MGEVVEGRVDALVQVALEPDAKGGDPGVAIEPEAFAYEIIGTDEVGAETDLGWHSLAGGILVAGQPEALHLAHVVAVALAFECVVVEVGCRGPHRAEG